MSIVDSLTLGIQSECPRGNEVRCCLLEPGGASCTGVPSPWVLAARPIPREGGVGQERFAVIQYYPFWGTNTPICARPIPLFLASPSAAAWSAAPPGLPLTTARPKASASGCNDRATRTCACATAAPG